ncbi:MAG: hypothetical protein Ct9H300mP23_07260 [Nitrospinota bacterium]|nr:MAG: hypothetical protein Ct9H300mP23_07260 [Nitrospinota bacterium]
MNIFQVFFSLLLKPSWLYLYSTGFLLGSSIRIAESFSKLIFKRETLSSSFRTASGENFLLEPCCELKDLVSSKFSMETIFLSTSIFLDNRLARSLRSKFGPGKDFFCNSPIKVQICRADLSCSMCLTVWVNYRDLGGGLVALVMWEE